jgi:hypothetical protein
MVRKLLENREIIATPNQPLNELLEENAGRILNPECSRTAGNTQQRWRSTSSSTGSRSAAPGRGRLRSHL